MSVKKKKWWDGHSWNDFDLLIQDCPGAKWQQQKYKEFYQTKKLDMFRLQGLEIDSISLNSFLQALRLLFSAFNSFTKGLLSPPLIIFIYQEKCICPTAKGLNHSSTIKSRLAQYKLSNVDKELLLVIQIKT